ncbi:MAG: hypothetical protein CMI98_01520 [Pelagibacteraceae bacterium]|nr:hypothetical protein [Pelagibacteraceae bacterium]|tara:strand:+ start:935 stop:1762 length:828 start_codon:yes stop_codon:yes gene_type:complete
MKCSEFYFKKCNKFSLVFNTISLCIFFFWDKLKITMLKHFHLLRWLIPNAVLITVVIGAWHFGFLTQLYSNDKSYISTLITIIYTITSLHCLYRLYLVSDQINSINTIKNLFFKDPNTALNLNENNIMIGQDFELKKNSHLNNYLTNLIQKFSKNDSQNNNTLLELFADKLRGETKVGSFIADSLFKLGLLGTIIGFVLMLQPISTLDSFDEISIKNALTSMSAGMSIALFTTLSGLVGGLLLKIQYFFLESAAEELFYNTSEISEVYIINSVKK